MSPIIIMLAATSYAMDCAGRDPDLCAAANTAATQVNLLSPVPGQVLVDDNHPTWKRRPVFFYNRFREMVQEGEALCGGPVKLEGTAVGVFDRTYLGNRNIEGLWADFGSPEASLQGQINGTNYVGYYEGDPTGHLGMLDAWHTGSRIRQDRDQGFWGGGRVWLGSGAGYFAAIYGSCAPPEVAPDTYDFISNVPLVAGQQGQGAVFAPHGLLDNDPEVAVIVGVTDGYVPCDDTEAPFDCPTAQGGLVTVYADGTFDYLPPAGGEADGFEIVVQAPQGGGTATSPVELEPTGRVWYVQEGGNGFGTLVEPAGSLQDIAGMVQPGDVVYLTGEVYAGSGIATTGDLRVVSGEVPLFLDLDLNGVPGPIDLSEYYQRATILVDGGPAFAFDTSNEPASVHVEGIDFVGDDGGAGRIAVSGATAHTLTLNSVNMEGSGIGVWIDQPASLDGAPSSLQVTNARFHGSMAVAGLTYGGDTSSTVTLADVELAETGYGLFVETSGDAQLTVNVADLVGATDGDLLHVSAIDQAHVQATLNQVELNGAGIGVALVGADTTTLELTVTDAVMTNVEQLVLIDASGQASVNGNLENIQAIWNLNGFDVDAIDDSHVTLYVENSEYEVDDTFLDVDARDAARVELAVAGVRVGAGEQAVRLHNQTAYGPGIQAHFVQNELASFGPYNTPGFQIQAMYEATTHVTLQDNLLYQDGPRAFAVTGDDRSETSLTLVANEFLGNRPELSFETADRRSFMCVDLRVNQVDRNGPVTLRQSGGSDFQLAGYGGSPTNPYQIEGFLRSRNDAEFEVVRYPASVYYRGTSSCPQDWTP